MKDKNSEKLIDKYESAQSTIEEEQNLYNRSDDSNPEVSSWLKFLKHHKTEAPVDFNEDLWKKFEGKTQSYRKLIITTLSIAASVLLFIAFTYSYSEKDNLSYEEKEALLKQSLELFSENEENIANQDILYEDESIIIYTKSNKN